MSQLTKKELIDIIDRKFPDDTKFDINIDSTNHWEKSAYSDKKFLAKIDGKIISNFVYSIKEK